MSNLLGAFPFGMARPSVGDRPIFFRAGSRLSLFERLEDSSDQADQLGELRQPIGSPERLRSGRRLPSSCLSTSISAGVGCAHTTFLLSED